MDLYSILGVSAEATSQEIREAYLSRSRVIHPDRFDRQRQFQDWKKANEMLAELNDAYAVLRDIEKRTEYDRARQSHPGQRSGPQAQDAGRSGQPSPPPRPDIEVGELTSGSAHFENLPREVQERLLRRQSSTEEDQARVRLESLRWKFIFIGGLGCWFWYLFADADGAKWKDDTLWWHLAFTVGVAVLIARNILKIVKWKRSSLKPNLYVTPIYFIRTDYDVVSFWPLWALKNISATHNYRNGIYQNTSLEMSFEGHNESLSVSSKNAVETLYERMNAFNARLRAAYGAGDSAYFRNNDDFYHVKRSKDQRQSGVPRGIQVAAYSVTLLLCLVAYGGAIGTNEQLSRKRWVRHDAASGYQPRIFSDEDFDDRPPAPASSRVFSEKDFLPEGATAQAPTPAYAQQALPKNGEVRRHSNGDAIAPLEIKAAQGSNYLVKLVDVIHGATALTVFVRSGQTASIEVPLGTYELRYASGDAWYGYEYLFGPETGYSKADKSFRFGIEGEQISGYTVTLYRVANGNLHTRSIRPADF